MPQHTFRTIVGTLLLLGGMSALTPAGASQVAGRVGPSDEEPWPASCSDDCTRKALDCIEACEEKFKDDDRARVTCKFECTTKRQSCEKECG